MREDITISKLIQNRWSPRSFDPNREITKEQLASLFEAVRLALNKVIGAYAIIVMEGEVS